MTAQTQQQVNQKRVKVKYMLSEKCTAEKMDSNVNVIDKNGVVALIKWIMDKMRELNPDLGELIDELERRILEDVNTCMRISGSNTVMTIDLTRCHAVIQFAAMLFFIEFLINDNAELIEIEVNTLDALLPLPRGTNIHMCVARTDCTDLCKEISLRSVIPIATDLSAIYLYHKFSR